MLTLDLFKEIAEVVTLSIGIVGPDNSDKMSVTLDLICDVVESSHRQFISYSHVGAKRAPSVRNLELLRVRGLLAKSRPFDVDRVNCRLKGSASSLVTVFELPCSLLELRYSWVFVFLQCFPLRPGEVRVLPLPVPCPVGASRFSAADRAPLYGVPTLTSDT